MRFQSALLVALATAFAYAQLSDVEEPVAENLSQLSDVEDAPEILPDNSPKPTAEEVNNTPNVADANENAPEESEPENANEADEVSGNNGGDEVTGENDDVDSFNSAPLEADDDEGEASDDYNAPFATDGAELSDGYEDASAVDSLDAPSDAAEDSEADVEPSNTGAIAAGVAGATAAAAGIFLWAKKSKKEENTIASLA